jgi:hypothetical protein
MDDKRKESALTRRGFIRGAALGSAGAVTLVIGAESAEAAAAPDQARPGRYTETDHIRAYYRSARM